jgi:hypothetical protein
MKEAKRPSEVNQQIAKSIRPQLPRDGSAGGVNYHISGKRPPSGYTAVWNFNGNTNTKDSSTTKPGNAGGKDIC